MTTPAQYWEARAQRFADDGTGLRAVCAFGMPAYYNLAIDLAQRLALRPWLRLPAGSEALDVGCGVGRWSRRLAHRGARVTGIDVSPTMIAEARRRAEAEDLASRCVFQTGELSALDLGRRFSLVLGVTVLQHIVDEALFEAAVLRLARHVSGNGRLVLLEAAPAAKGGLTDSQTLRFRSEAHYLTRFDAAQLELEAVTGVDPLPFKIRFLSHYARLPAPLAKPILALLTAASLPAEVLVGRSWRSRSWHKVFVFKARRAV